MTPAPTPDAEETRTRTLSILAVAWGLVTIVLLWLFERAFAV